MPEQAAENLDALRRHLKRLVEDEQDRVGTPGIEKRRHKRHLYMVEAHVRYVKRFDKMGSCPNEFTVYTKDLSRSGLSFLHEHEMYLGEVVEVEVHMKDSFRRKLLVKIARCRRAGLKVFNIAGVFIDETEAAGAAADGAAEATADDDAAAEATADSPASEDDPSAE